MKTSISINTDLLERARRRLKTRTIKDTVEKSLEHVVRQEALERLSASAGAFDLDLTAATLRRHRRKRTPRGSR